MKDYKAKYVGKVRDRFGRAVHLFYEYRGHEYMITDEHNGYSETMREKHMKEQRIIDTMIEEKQKTEKEFRYEDTAEYGFELFWKYVEGESAE